MGKPFDAELGEFGTTYQWALKAPIDFLRVFVNASQMLPLIAVGSGGSVTAAHMAALLHQSNGPLAKSVTPFDLTAFGKPLRDSAVLILSAGGRNADIMTAFKSAATAESRHLMAFCMSKGSPLSQLSRQFRYTGCAEFNLPCGKDGFLATNSLVAFITLLIRAYSEFPNSKGSDDPRLDFGGNYELPDTIEFGKKLLDSLEGHEEIQALVKKDTWIVLHGGWGLPAAADLESKFSEAALGHVLLADYRNFGHGRHHWLAKRGPETGVLALITPAQKAIAQKTLALLPQSIVKVELSVENDGPLGGLDLLIRTMHLAQLMGVAKNIDPGRPGVPEFGSKLYHLRLPAKSPCTEHGPKLTSQARKSISRKSGLYIEDMNSKEILEWKKKYDLYLTQLLETTFGSIVFDYDGTLCDPFERLVGPSDEVQNALNGLLSNSVIIGVATGRGKSVRQDLQKAVDKKYWDQLLIGYYNGSDISTLSDLNHPVIEDFFDDRLNQLADNIKSDSHLLPFAKIQYRPNQITIETHEPKAWAAIRSSVIDLIGRGKFHELRVLESSHSIDIVAAHVSKLNLVTRCSKVAREQGKSEDVLTIGDKGKWPGNDYQLLSIPNSVSVDEVSPNPRSCWNFGPPGYKGTQSTLWYLSHLCHVKEGLRFSKTVISGKK